MSTLSVKLRNSDGTAKTLTFANGQSDVTVTQINAFREKYDSLYQLDNSVESVYYQPTVPKIKLFE